MSIHEYTPKQALDTLMQKLEKGDPQLAAKIQAAIDAGKDIRETDPGRQRRRPRYYRKTVPLSYEEALDVAMDALRAYFIEQPLFVNSCVANMSEAAIDVQRHQLQPPPWFDAKEQSDHVALQAKGKERTIVIELQTETQIPRREEEPFELTAVDTDELREQRHNWDSLKSLVSFGKE